ncbi:MAG: poly-beta-1,6-N-acetyl-D-glucosamine synthase [Methylococcales bacterium]
MLETLSLKLFYYLQLLLGFTYYYPLYMAYLWMLGAIFFYFRHEFRRKNLPVINHQPRVSIVVPCFNEESNAVEVISHLFSLNYSNYEIIAVNDGSTDNTKEILEQLSTQDSRLRVIHHAENQGKAVALNTAAQLATGEYIIGIDGDALLDTNAITWFMHHFNSNKKIGAVTGNPRIRTRSTLLGRLQVGEFSSLVGLIKRAQKTFYGHIFTASGVITAFRYEALKDVNYWSPNMLTEDMDITWKLQLKGWQVDFEPRALAWILMPESLSGLWKQRLRWAMGGLQIIGKYKSMFKDWRSYPMWPLMFEHLLSIVWACSVSLVFASYLFEFLSVAFETLEHTLNAYFVTVQPAALSTSIAEISQKHVNISESMTVMLPEFSGVIIGTTCLLQMLVAVMLDRHYDHKLLRYYLWTVWYPFGFWLINMLTIVTAIPKTFIRGHSVRARWVSPDRGIQNNPIKEVQPTLNKQQSKVTTNNDIVHNKNYKLKLSERQPLIIDHFNQQSMIYQGLSNGFTIIGWSFWLYLWLPIMNSLLILTGLTDKTSSEGSATLSRLASTLSDQMLTILAVLLFFLIWSVLCKLGRNRFTENYKKKNKRAPNYIKGSFDLSLSRLILVHHQEGTGLIQSVEPVWSTPQTSPELSNVQTTIAR